MKYEYVFWDWNGTLFDDAEASWLAVNDMLTARKLPPITFLQYKEYIDVPIVKFYEKIMDTSNECMDDMSLEFHTLCYNHLPQNPLANHSEQILDFLHNCGTAQYIYSSSHKDRIIPCLERYGLDGYFEDVLAADDCFAGSKLERTRDFIVKNGISTDRSVFIGDLIHDFEVASAIGSDCILVANGHQSADTLRKTGAVVINSLDELFNIFSKEVE